MAALSGRLSETEGGLRDRDTALKQLRKKLDHHVATAEELERQQAKAREALRSRAAELEGQNVGLEAAVAKATEQYEELAAARESIAAERARASRTEAEMVNRINDLELACAGYVARIEALKGKSRPSSPAGRIPASYR